MSTASSEIEAEVIAEGDLGLSLLHDKTEPISVVEPIPVPPVPAGPIERIGLRAALVVLRAVLAVKRAAARLVARRSGKSTTSGVVRYVRRYGRTDRTGAQRGRHRAKRLWFGRQRSTSERCAANAAACRARAKEDDLPETPPEYVGWVENFIETLRYEQEVLHPAQHTERQFICS